MFTYAILSILCVLVRECIAQVEDDGVYRGKHLGKFNSYHHQVSGDVYAVDQYTFLIKKFIYGGGGTDTFFWTGTTNQPGPQGLLVPDENGRTNKLEPYLNDDITITLLDGKKITDFKWLAVFDLSVGKAFADVYIPKGFEPPSPQRLSDLSGVEHGVTSGHITIRDAKSLLIKDFSYDGKGTDTHFWVGTGYQPSPRGTKVPDEMGYIGSLRSYSSEDVYLELPGKLSVFDIDWFSIYDVAKNKSYGSINIPNQLNVPPSLVEIVDHEVSYPNCEQLHKRLRVSWDIYGPTLTVEMVGQIEDGEYMAFGFSGSTTKSTMEGADVLVAHLEEHLFILKDYNITSRTPCSNTLGTYQGVCPDTKMGGMENFQFHTGSTKDGLTIITFRRPLQSPDTGDFHVIPEDDTYIIWALGSLDSKKNPMFHSIYPKADIKFKFGRANKQVNCPAFTKTKEVGRKAWGPFHLTEPQQEHFLAHIGPSGGHRGYKGITGMPSIGYSWYIDGYLVPELFLKRGRKYKFKVEGGNNPYNPHHYHPLIITDEPIGAFGSRSQKEQENIKVYAGVKFSRRGQPRPTAAGRLCLWTHRKGTDRRQDDDFSNFKIYRNSLDLKCDDGDPAYLEVTPNSTWPEVVYYNSYTHPHMGWKIHIVDSLGRVNKGHSHHVSLLSLLSVIILNIMVL